MHQINRLVRNGRPFYQLSNLLLCLVWTFSQVWTSHVCRRKIMEGSLTVLKLASIQRWICRLACVFDMQLNFTFVIWPRPQKKKKAQKADSLVDRTLSSELDDSELVSQTCKSSAVHSHNQKLTKSSFSCWYAYFRDVEISGSRR